jgi:hypothetical protein
MSTIGIKTNTNQAQTQTNKQTNKQKTPFDLKINKIKHIGHELQQKIAKLLKGTIHAYEQVMYIGGHILNNMRL